MTDAPETIYLQWIPEGHPADDEITWCVDEINENDTEYTRTDIAHPRIAEMESEIEEAHESIDELVHRIAEWEGYNADQNTIIVRQHERIAKLEKYIKDHDYKTILDYMEKYLEGDME